MSQIKGFQCGNYRKKFNLKITEVCYINFMLNVMAMSEQNNSQSICVRYTFYIILEYLIWFASKIFLHYCWSNTGKYRKPFFEYVDTFTYNELPKKT